MVSEGTLESSEGSGGAFLILISFKGGLRSTVSVALPRKGGSAVLWVVHGEEKDR